MNFTRDYTCLEIFQDIFIKGWEDLLWEMVKDTPRPHNDKT